MPVAESQVLRHSSSCSLFGGLRIVPSKQGCILRTTAPAAGRPCQGLDHDDRDGLSHKNFKYRGAISGGGVAVETVPTESCIRVQDPQAFHFVLVSPQVMRMIRPNRYINQRTSNLSVTHNSRDKENYWD